MRRRFLAIWLTMACFLIGSPLMARDLSETLKSLAPSLMTSRHVPGLQIVVFRPGRELSLAFGTTGDQPIDENTLFFSGELSTALLPLLLEEELQKENLSIRDAFSPDDASLLLYARFQESMLRPGNLYQISLQNRKAFQGKQIFEGLGADRTFLLNLYHSVSGLPPSRAGIAPASIDAALLSKSLAADETPYSRIAFSSEGTQILLDYLSRLKRQSIEDLLQGGIESIGLKRSRYVGGAADVYGAREDLKGLAAGYISDERPVLARRPYIVYPGIYGLISNAKETALVMRRLAERAKASSEQGRAHDPFSSYFAYDPSLGGVSGPFHLRRLCGNRVLFEISSRFPGYVSYSAFSPDGRGIVMYANADDMALLHRLSERILLDLFTECPPPGSDRLRIDTTYNSTMLGWFDNDAVALEKWVNRLEGTYRPEGILPRKRESFAFMGDVRLRLNSEGRMEMSGFYDREIPVHLVPDTEPFVFTATGRAAMAGWKIKFIQAETGEIVGFYTDQAAYQRVIWGDSIWGRIVGFAFSLFLVALLILLFYLKKKKAL